jgi:hypothetical protein
VEYGAGQTPAKPSPESDVIIVNPQTREHTSMIAKLLLQNLI